MKPVVRKVIVREGPRRAFPQNWAIASYPSFNRRYVGDWTAKTPDQSMQRRPPIEEFFVWNSYSRGYSIKQSKKVLSADNWGGVKGTLLLRTTLGFRRLKICQDA